MKENNDDDVNVNFSMFSKKDRELLKFFLLVQLYCYLQQKFNLSVKEDEMINPKLIRTLLIELINEEVYTLDGIADVTRTPIDVIYDIALGINSNPSITTSILIIWEYITAKRSELTEKFRDFFLMLENGKIL